MCIIATVGLPGRGKSYIAQKLYRSLTWLGYTVKVFNAGEYRRRHYKDIDNLNEYFFNPEQKDLRDDLANKCFDELLEWMNSHSEVNSDKIISIFDATNSTKDRRKTLYNKINGKYKLLFIESVVNDKNIINAIIYRTR